MAEPLLCTQCGAVPYPQRVLPGSTWITLVLLFFFIVPGLIYMIWRHTSVYSACAKCGSRYQVPVDSPFGKDIIATRPSAAASLVEAKRGENDMLVGGMILLGIVVLIALVMWLRS